jgi:uncharacterized damage-inducible protein DinB
MIQSQLQNKLISLASLLQQLTDEQYTRKIRHLGEASIGGHCRHIIEIVQCVINGYDTGQVDYIRRYRNTELEINREAATGKIQEVTGLLTKPDQSLDLYVETETGPASSMIRTTYFREIIYAIEHTVHHLALIKVALTDMDLPLADDQFGVAYSTMLYRKTTKSV